MRRRLVVANWKLNKTVAEAQQFVAELRGFEPLGAAVEAVIAPPYTALQPLAAPLARLGVQLCAQEIYYEDAGAFTGAVSAPLVAEAGARYCLVGHSERRNLFGESVASSQRRLQAALASSLRPILCLGENLAEREAGRTLEVVREQLVGALGQLSGERLIDLVLAYEPVWAIGTGRRASPEQAAEVHRDLRAALASERGEGLAAGCRILYGGSVTAEGIAAMLASDEIDGALVGGASLTASSFARLLAEVAERARC